jgi:hypothetical protein
VNSGTYTLSPSQQTKTLTSSCPAGYSFSSWTINTNTSPVSNIATNTLNIVANAYGNIAITANCIDSTAPTSPSIIINAGATYTTSTSVSLTLSATDAVGVTQMCISNDTTTCTARETYTTTKTRTLANTQGTRTVYVKFRDAALNESAQVNDTIIFDNVAPSTPSVGYSPAQLHSGDITVTASSTDTTSNISGYSFDNGATWQAGTTKVFTATTSNTIKVKDNAGNISAGTAFTVTIDKIAPIISSVTGSPTLPTSGNVTVTINGSDTGGAGLHTTAYSFDNGVTRQAGNTKVSTEN